MYIYMTDLYLYKNVYQSINLSTMYFKAEIKAIIEVVFSFFFLYSI